MPTSENSPGAIAGAEERRISSIVRLVHELTRRGIQSETAPDLFCGAFESLFQCVPFDVAVAVLIEQHLELYISTRRGGEALVDDVFIGGLRQTLESLIPVSFATTDLIVKAEWHDLPQLEGASQDRAMDSFRTIFRLDSRIAGLVVIHRAETLAAGDRQVCEIFASQVSLLLGNLSARARILSLADTDDLTGVWNKRYLRRHLPQELERARVYGLPLSLLIFDVDEFKEINDTFGHTIGDVVLSELCGAVREILRPPDFIARFGGDEFAVVLPHTDTGGARSVAERVLDRVRKVVLPTEDDGEIRCSVSVGVATYGATDVSAMDLVRRADEALYQAKRAGKNRAFASES